MTVCTCLVVALSAEAKPLIQHYSLKREGAYFAFEIYRKNEIALVVCGVGKSNAAAGTAYLGSIVPASKNHIWINFGIAGHQSYPLGNMLLGEKITDTATQQSWYPPMINLADVPGDQIHTVDTPQNNYPKKGVVEMEASGFIATARRFSSSELVQCVKVISDNEQQPATNINAAKVAHLCSNNLALLETIITRLRSLAEQLDSLETPQQLLQTYHSQWRFSVTQTHQLEQLLQRWRALDDKTECWMPSLTEEKSSKALLRRLRIYLDTLPIKLKPIKSP